MVRKTILTRAKEFYNVVANIKQNEPWEYIKHNENTKRILAALFKQRVKYKTTRPGYFGKDLI